MTDYIKKHNDYRQEQLDRLLDIMSGGLGFDAMLTMNINVPERKPESPPTLLESQKKQVTDAYERGFDKGWIKGEHETLMRAKPAPDKVTGSIGHPDGKEPAKKPKKEKKGSGRKPVVHTGSRSGPGGKAGQGEGVPHTHPDGMEHDPALNELTTKGEKRVRSRQFTTAEIQDIRAKRMRGHTLTWIATQYDRAESAIGNVVNQKTYANVLDCDVCGGNGLARDKADPTASDHSKGSKCDACYISDPLGEDDD